jgi:hypothetical protein
MAVIDSIAHIVNPVVVSEPSDLVVAQPITFATMRAAREHARGRVNVELYSAQYAKDTELVPDDVTATRDLDRSVLDVGTFPIPRELPLLRDILDRLYDATQAELLVYTNVDIALLPHFYLVVARLVEHGYDAFIINRRTVTTTHHGIDDVPLMAAEVGRPHPGLDCFVFRRSAYPRYFLGDVCVGAGGVGWALMYNLRRHAAKFEIFEDYHVTFHLGDSQVWRSEASRPYARHNARQNRRICRHYREDPRAVAAKGTIAVWRYKVRHFLRGMGIDPK